MMEFSDVGIYFESSDSEIWAEFLQERLKEAKVNATLENLSDEDEQCDRRHHVRVVLAAPGILEIPIPDKLYSMVSEHSLFVLLGVDEVELKSEFARQNFKKIFDWQFFKAEETTDSVSGLVNFIKSQIEGARRTCEVSNYDRLPAPRPSLPELRHVNPKESALTPQLQIATVEQEETIEVFIISNRKGADEVEICFSHMPGGFNTSALIDDKALYQIHITDESILETGCNFEARDGAKTIGSGTIPIFKKVDFDTIESYVPTKSEVIRDIFGEGNDPTPLVCQLVGLTDHDESETDLDLLDNHLANTFKTWKTENSSECEIFINDDDIDKNWPSLLHYAAELNFQKFGKELLDHPCSIKACYTMNSEKAIPQTIADRNNNTEFYRMIRSFLKVESLKGNIPNDLFDSLPTIKESQTVDQEYEKKQKNNNKFWKKVKSKLRKKRSKTFTSGSAVEEIGIPKNLRVRSNSTQEDFTERSLSISSTSSSERAESGYYDSTKNGDIDGLEDVLEEPNQGLQAHLHHSHSLTLPSQTKF